MSRCIYSCCITPLCGRCTMDNNAIMNNDVTLVYTVGLITYDHSLNGPRDERCLYHCSNVIGMGIIFCNASILLTGYNYYTNTDTTTSHAWVIVGIKFCYASTFLTDTDIIIMIPRWLLPLQDNTHTPEAGIYKHVMMSIQGLTFII